MRICPPSALKNVQMIQESGVSVVRLAESSWYSHSSQTGSVNHTYPDGKELTGDRKVKKGEKLSLEPWGI